MNAENEMSVQTSAINVEKPITTKKDNTFENARSFNARGV